MSIPALKIATAAESPVRPLRRRGLSLALAYPPAPAGVTRDVARDRNWKLAVLGGLAACALLVAVVPGSALLFGSLSVGVGTSLLLPAYLVVRSLLSLFYRPVPPPPEAQLPSCTVIVPAYNEGANVLTAILSVLDSDYPADRVEVIAVDDGSKDDTWSFIAAAAKAHPTRVTALRLERNSGKREALAAGVERARGEVLVTVDSDSRLEPDALRHLVAPFVADPRVGLACGTVRIWNRHANILTQMAASLFRIGNATARRPQSLFGSVLCSPGVISAFRKTVLSGLLPEWRRQTFLRAPCTIGEDRALNTLILREGHRAVYQSTAVACTIMPTSLGRMFKMLLRWERANIRESLLALPVVLRPRVLKRVFPATEVLSEVMYWPAACLGAVAFVNLLLHVASVPAFVCGVALTAMVPAIHSLRDERNLDFVYYIVWAFFNFTALLWLFPYSLFTVRNGKWLTR